MRSVVAVAVAVVGSLMTEPMMAQVTYIDSTPTPGGNTTRLDGSNWAPQAVSNIDHLWRTRGAGFGNGDTIAEANANGAENAHMLVTTISGLTAGVQYNIFGYFWSQVSSAQDWKLKATIDPSAIQTNGTLTLTDDFLPTVPTISFSKLGSTTVPASTNAPALATGFDGTDNLGVTFDANNLSTSYFTSPTKVKQADNTLAMFQAALGIATADPTGKVKVYIDDVENQTASFRTWYDGVGYSVVTSPTLTINRTTGAATFNTGFERDIIGYSIKSASGTLKQANWNTITGHYDSPPGGDGSIDDNDDWVVLSNAGSKTDLSEGEFGLGGPLDGAVLEAGTAISFGTVWQKHFSEDVRMELLLNDVSGTIENVQVIYTGNSGQPYKKGDFNFDGAIGPADYSIFIGSLLDDVTGSIADAYRLGDLNGDITVGYDDLLEFRDIYDIANGAGAFVAMASGVPEPSGLFLVGVAAIAVVVAGRRRDGARAARLLALAVLPLACTSMAQAQTTYVDATETPGGNTTRLDGTNFVSVPDNLPDGLWRKRTFGNSGTIYETNAGGAEDGYMLATTIIGLAPNAQYYIYSYFWSNPNENWRLKSTVNPLSVNNNGTAVDLSDDFLDNDPSVAFSATGSATSTAAPLAQTKFFGTPTLILDTSTSPNLQLHEAVLGVATADATGKVKVYVDDLEDQGSSLTRTFFDGVGYERVQPLTLEVNTVAGWTRLINSSGAAINFNYYQVTSTSNSLNAAAWQSLDLQNYDAMDGADVGTIPGDSQLEGWDAAGGSDDNLLGEVKFLSSSTLANQAFRSLGKAFKPGGTQDLQFTFEIGGRLRSGVVQYVNTAPIPGDYDHNGIVQPADYTLWRSTIGSTVLLDADGNGNHVVDAADYVFWRNNYAGSGVGSGLGSSVSAVPEPTSVALIVLATAGILSCSRKRRSTAPHNSVNRTCSDGFTNIRKELVSRMMRQICIQATAIIVSACVVSSAVAAVFPDPSIPQNNSTGTNRMNGVKKALYSVVHDVSDPFTPAEWTTRVNAIRSKELVTRDFYAENSGGKFDIYYDQVIDVPITLNADGTRPADWVTQSNAVATSTYGLNTSDYYMLAYDVNQTVADPDQGWGGLSTSNRIYLQSISQNVTNHEIGHRVSADHAKAIVARNDANYHTYTWNAGTHAYEPYIPGVSPFTPTPFGAASYEYGNPFDTMGNIGGGNFRIREKLEDLGWLTTTQVRRLDGATGLGAGTYKIYAHDELQATTSGSGVHGVVNTYNPTALYGITYNRAGQRFNASTSSWVNETQVIDIEYRSDADGAAFYLNGALVDLDSEGGTTYSNTERLLEVGRSIEDTNFGMSNYFADAGAIGATPSGIDFLALNPPPPTTVAASWFHFTALGTGVDAIGSYIQLQIAKVDPLNGVVGDLNQDGSVTAADLNLFIAGWSTDTSSLNSVSKYHFGDINLNGTTDLSDAFLMHRALIVNGVSGGLSQFLATVPEPGTLTLVGFVALVMTAGARKRMVEANSAPRRG